MGNGGGKVELSKLHGSFKELELEAIFQALPSCPKKWIWSNKQVWWLGELCGASVWGVWDLSCCKQLLGVLLVSIRISIVELQHCETWLL